MHATIDLLPFACFDEDPIGHQNAVRDFIGKRIAEKAPIFPNRKLGLEYAGINSGIPRGVPIAGVAISNLCPGDTLNWCRREWMVISIGKTLVIKSGEGTSMRIAPDTLKWNNFCRDMEAELVRFSPWAEETDLMKAWRRDPIACHIPDADRFLHARTAHGSSV